MTALPGNRDYKARRDLTMVVLDVVNADVVESALHRSERRSIEDDRPDATPMTLSPVIAPPAFVEPGPTRDLLAALHENGWLVQLPASDGWATVFSPNGSRSMKVSIDTEAEDLDRLDAFISGVWLPTAWAATYVRGS